MSTIERLIKELEKVGKLKEVEVKANIKPTKKNESEYTSGTSMLEIPLDYEGQPETVIIYIRPKDFQEAGMII